MASYTASLATIAGFYLIAVVSPGPNFFVLSQLSLGGRRRHAVLVALGITAGSLIWVSLAMFGVAAVLARMGWLYIAIRVAGAPYLVWFGCKLLRSAIRLTTVSVPEVGTMQPSRALWTGVVPSLTNPKSGASWTSVFASAFPAHAPFWLYAATIEMVASLSLIWHLGVVFAFASARIRKVYSRLRRPLDGLCGAVLVTLGIRLAVSR